MDKALHLIGYASGIAGADTDCAKGPLVLKQSPYFSQFNAKYPVKWEAMIYPPVSETSPEKLVGAICKDLAQMTAKLTKAHQPFCVLGGDHTSAIGTWSGVADAMRSVGDIGLIWLDAHMDSHTPESSETGRIHGMPLACLLGHGSRLLTSILNPYPKIKPEHVCLIGVRSFERGEADLLKRLNVRIYYMDEIKERGLKTVLNEALEIVKKGTVGYGLSLDLDGLDPKDAPAVDVPCPDGIRSAEIQKALPAIIGGEGFLGLEIVEFDPVKDRNHLTEQLIISFLEMQAKENIVA